jgi:hypothetical protein
LFSAGKEDTVKNIFQPACCPCGDKLKKVSSSENRRDIQDISPG